MNPLLWLNAVSVPSLLVGALAFKDQPWLAAPMVLGSLGIPGWTLWEYRYFARKDPQRLHSEEYLIEQQRLMLQSKSSPQPIDATAIPAGANPELSDLRDQLTVSPSLERPNVAVSSQEIGDE